MTMKLYCPMCGVESDVESEDDDPEPFVLAPGECPEPFACPECGQRWRVRVEFFPVGE